MIRGAHKNHFHRQHPIRETSCDTQRIEVSFVAPWLNWLKSPTGCQDIAALPNLFVRGGRYGQFRRQTTFTPDEIVE